MKNALTLNEMKNIFDKTSSQFEIERKFLLKNIPDDFKLNGKIIELTSFYLTENPHSAVADRIRLEKSESETKIIQTTKTPTGNDAIRQELEAELTIEEFEKFKPFITHYIKKTRYIKYVDDYKWEIDDFHNIKLIMAEVELITKRLNDAIEVENELNKINIPDIIQSELIYEVTPMIEFSNKQLAVKFNCNINELI